MGSLTFNGLASCLPVLACMCASACQATDEFEHDDITMLRDADGLQTCSEVDGNIELLVDPNGTVWLDGERELGDEELVVAVGDAMSVALCMEFAASSDQARIRAHDGDQQLLGSDDGTASCVVMLRPLVSTSSGQQVPGALVLDIETLEPEASSGGFEVFYLAPVKSSGKIKVVGTCPKFAVYTP